MNKQKKLQVLPAAWRNALTQAVKNTRIPALDEVIHPHEWHSAEAVSKALLILKFKNAKAYDLAYQHGGTPRARLEKIYIEEGEK